MGSRKQAGSKRVSGITRIGSKRPDVLRGHEYPNRVGGGVAHSLGICVGVGADPSHGIARHVGSGVGAGGGHAAV